MFEQIYTSGPYDAKVPTIYAHLSLALEIAEVKHIRKVVRKLHKTDFSATVIEILRCAYGNVAVPCKKARSSITFTVKHLESAMHNICTVLGIRNGAAQELLDRNYAIDVFTELAMDMEEHKNRGTQGAVFSVFRWAVLDLFQLSARIQTNSIPRFCVFLCVRTLCQTINAENNSTATSVAILGEVLQADGAESYFEEEDGVQLVGDAMKTLRSCADSSCAEAAEHLLGVLRKRFAEVIAEYVSAYMKRAFPDLDSIALFSGARSRHRNTKTEEALALTITKLWR